MWNAPHFHVARSYALDIGRAAVPSKLATAIRGLGEYMAKKTKKARVGRQEEGRRRRAVKKQSLLDATLEKFDKSRAYVLDKSTFDFISGAYSPLGSTVSLLLGYLSFVWTISGQALTQRGLDADHEIYRTLMMLTLTTIHETIMASSERGLYFARWGCRSSSTRRS
ncbi:hypothetical protein Poli38472_014581 [Pythium oligandrum]|uniref:CAAX prenyl protease 1 N-terminal domain-containing protein n=1 Tax=Pythium oligandrum TaxID=41045 RepID=A0A8K1CQ06_PYTOL|nr:hypothetical protein Poli38472_014581 [Pythium oligandrum]|eukprot:TMW66605.1 hypothetical protein Poli38472_014581 [Pythium oligandrum]